MKITQKGFTVTEILIVLVIAGAVGSAGWFIAKRQESGKKTSSTPTTQLQETNDERSAEETDHTSLDGINFKVPTDWKRAEGPFKDDKTGAGPYFLSPDYKEAGGGQLFIQAGAYINIQKLTWTGIDSSTSLEQAVTIVRDGEGGYLDPKSVKLDTVNGKQVIVFNSGHTTDGVTVLHKTANGQWLDAGFSTTTGGDAKYNAQDSPHYKTFLSWLEEFVQLNP